LEERYIKYASGYKVDAETYHAKNRYRSETGIIVEVVLHDAYPVCNDENTGNMLTTG